MIEFRMYEKEFLNTMEKREKGKDHEPMKKRRIYIAIANLMLASFLLNDSSETLPDLRSDFSPRVSHHLVEIDGKKLTLFADLLAANKDSVDIASGDTEVKLPWEVTSIEVSRRVVIEQQEISEAARLKTTNGVLEELAGDEGVVAEEEVEGLHSANTGVLSLELVDEAAATVLLEHIIGHTISAETDTDTLGKHVPDARNTDSIVLVALGVGHDVGVSASDDVNLIVVKEDTVAHDGVLTKHTELLKTRDATHAVHTHALILIVLTLSDVDVETSVDAREVLAELLDLCDGLLQGFIAAGEGSVETKGSTEERVLLLSTLAHEADVLLDTLLCTGDAVTVSNLVAEASTGTALGGGTGDVIKRADDAIRAGVVVDDAGSTALECLGSEDLGAEVVGFLVEGTVQTPPEALEDLEEGLGRFIDETHTAGVQAVVVTVATDEARDDVHALGVDALSAFGDLLEDFVLGTDLNDDTVLHGHSTVLDHTHLLTTKSDDGTIEHDLISSHSFLRTKQKGG